ncbi:histidine phosphatase family protein [Metabacillus iocasae]|uniref:Alpha-ribazole phosphatase n=1 Tax=Priestia iocasae TaxID=2291674 RepID=A0ABS2QRS4_9BACI|nr:histidine phosphatase family protein [Metabacillus iocasae]MBM7701993.1 alpha-ribazole phosphatase [Metabacillus iocasae]
MDHSLVITCIRHGLTAANREKRYIGWTDVSLCQDGMDSLKSSQLLIDRPDIIISSDLIRCVETTKLLFPGISYSPSSSWREINFGAWELRTYEDLKEKPHYQNWLNDPFNVSPIQGESFYEFSIRIWQAWDELIHLLMSRKYRHAVIVTHGGPLRLLASTFVPDRPHFWEWSFHFGEGCTFFHTEQTARERRSCISYSEVRLTEKENG